MDTSIVPDVLTVAEARALRDRAAALGLLGNLTRRVLVPLLDGVQPHYDANHMTMWAVLNEDAEAGEMPAALPSLLTWR